LGWRVVFLVNLPIGLAAAYLSRAIPESRLLEATAIDWAGIGLATLGLTLLLVPLLEGPNAGWPLWTWGCLAASALTLGIFLAWERGLARRGGGAAIDLALFANRGFAAGVIVVLAVYSTATSLFLCFALVLQSGRGRSPFAAGCLFAPASVGFVAASLTAPKWVARFGDGAIAWGALIYSAGILWLIVEVGALTGPEDALRLLPALVLFGFGQGLSMTPLLNLVIGFVEEHHAGMAAGIVSTMQQVGGAFGVAVVGIFFVSLLADHPAGAEPNAERYAAAFSGAMVYNLSAVAFAAALVLWIARRSKPA